MYISRPDTSLLMELLLHDPDIAFLVPDGSKRWRAVKEMNAQGNERVGLWHVPSGPLPLLPPVHGDPIQQIHDPWFGWKEERTGADPNTPFFAAHTGVFWLNLHVEGKDRGSCCGLSSFEWVGNRYKIIGKGSQPSTEDWWKWGYKNFCVNGQLAGNCCTPMEMQINDRYERTDRQPAG
jgi:hypothetical protein